MFRIVLLPQPEGPTSEMNSPGRTSIEMSSNATTGGWERRAGKYVLDR